ncbi:MAG: type I methionyl aminopeptidase [Patescibacteria group bacterium]|nr:type I methionyl aminopeptidase [Patescibacteria group bacterium]
MIKIKSKKDIEKMAKGGLITAKAREEVLKAAVPGVKTADLEELAVNRIKELGGEPGFMKVPGYDCATCINLNAGLVHGVPSENVTVEEGDVFTVDLGTFYKGFHTDAAWSIVVGNRRTAFRGLQEKEHKEKKRFLEVGEEALERATEQCVPGNFVGDISHAIQETVEGAGYNVIRALVGHGVGEELHEGPQIPCFGKPGEGSMLEEGLVLAVEILYAEGGPAIETLDDGWTIKTKDNSLSALFENTIAVTEGGSRVLTPNPKF